MPRERLTMRRIRQVQQLHFGAHSGARVIAREVGVGRTTVQDYLARAGAAGLGWPLAPDLTDEALEQLLFPAPSCKVGARRYPEPDWATLVREMKRPGVTLAILWEEYNAVHPQGYAYSRFCELYREFERRLSPAMRQTHVAGHKAFVDYSGKKVPITDPLTGEVRMAEIFVAVLNMPWHAAPSPLQPISLSTAIYARIHAAANTMGQPASRAEHRNGGGVAAAAHS